MCHRLSGLSTYGLKGLRQGDEHPAYAQHWARHLYLPLSTVAKIDGSVQIRTETIEEAKRGYQG